MYCGCLCSAGALRWSRKAVADVLGVTEYTVSNAVAKWKKNNRVWKPFHRFRNPQITTKFTPAQIATVCSREVLQKQVALSLHERASHLQATEDMDISCSSILRFYRQNGIRFRRVDLHCINKQKQAVELQQKQWEHCNWLVQTLGKEKHVYWMDESSIHIWLNKNTTWTDNVHPVYVSQ